MDRHAEKRRIFLALNLPLSLKNELRLLLEELKKVNEEIRWVNSENTHMTLHFLGNLNEDELKKVKNVCDELAGKFGNIRFEIYGLSALPNLLKGRIIYLACKQTNGNAARELQKVLGKSLTAAGLVIDKRPWKIHITLGRVKSGGIFTNKNVMIKKKKFSLESFELMESELTPKGSNYKTIKSFKL